jgi:hypothetical protein
MTMRFGAWVAAAAVAMTIGSAAIATAADDKATATGTWKWEFKRQNGEAIEVTLKLKQDGEKLTGTITGRNNTETEIKDGKVTKDGDVSFEVVREFNGNSFTQKYTGKLSGDAIKGKIEFERNGEAQSRDWEAKRGS